MSTSSATGAHDLVAAFRSGDSAEVPAAWRLDRDVIADRLDELIAEPTRVRQGRLNLCGPAAVLSLWFARDPVAAATYAISLFESGSAAIGDLRVVASPPLRQLPYGRVGDARGADQRGRVGDARGADQRGRVGDARGCPQADWMMMAAMRDSANRVLRYRRAGGPWEAASAITMPSAMRRWLAATGVFSVVRDETNLVLRKGLAHATGLRMARNQELLLLVAQEMFRRPGTWQRRARDRMVSLVPNHWIVLRSPVEVRPDGSVRLGFWSWGANHEAVLPVQAFDRCYYGCLRAVAAPSAD